MAWKEFRYSNHLQGNGIAYRPIVSVEIKNGVYSYTGLGLIDSGTDGIIMDIEIAKVLNLSLQGAEEVSLAGVGTAKGLIVESVLNFDFLELEESIAAPVVIVENMPLGILLGQRDFFERFDIRFEKRKKKFFIRTAE